MKSSRRQFVKTSAIGVATLPFALDGFKMISCGSPVSGNDMLKAIPNPDWENAIPVHFVWHAHALDDLTTDDFGKRKFK